MNKTKTVVAWSAIVLALLTLVSGAYAILFDHPNALWWKEATGLINMVLEEIQLNGLSPNLGDYLSEGSGTKDWVFTAVLEPQDSDGVLMVGKIVAASDPLLVGLLSQEAYDRVSGRLPEMTGLSSYSKDVEAPDGTQYCVEVCGAPKHFLGYSWLVGTTLFYSAIAAWLALSAWIALDVRDLQKAYVVPWTVLGLVTGPVALGVWLISRPNKDRVEPSNCPACGSTIPKGAAYCVRCGHPVLPLCPKCNRRVGLDWEYCGSCGVMLSDEP